jgi:hypothetical protein
MSTDLMRMRSRRFLFAFASVAVFGLLAACGSKTGLILPFDEDASPTPIEAGADVVHHKDAPAPVEEDAAEEDALPPIDVTPPPPDAFTDCPDAGATLVYVITQSNDLFSFYPPTATFTKVGTIACPTPVPSQPFSMAVNHKGIAYIVFQSGDLFRVSTLTAACQATGFKKNQGGFATTFGMAFSGDNTPEGETLYVAGDGTPPALARIDVANGYGLTTVGDFNPAITAAELTGTRAGDLFGFWDPGNNFNPDSAIVQIDKTNAVVTNSTTLPGVEQGNGWAFAFWGGDFYTFTAPNGGTQVTRFRPSDGSVTLVATSNETVVGAGVSTCAPQE